jgi:hypothetical protein
MAAMVVWWRRAAAVSASVLLAWPSTAHAQAEQGANTRRDASPASPKTEPPRSEPKAPWAFGSFYRGFGVATGPLAGRVGSQVGVSVGKPGFAFMVGGLPGNRLVSLGFEAPRFPGFVLGRDRRGAAELALLMPSLEAHFITDFGDNRHLNFGSTLCGLGYKRPFGGAANAFFLQVRAPMLGLWLPLMVNGLSIGRNLVDSDYLPTKVGHSEPFLSVGAGLEAGVIL